MKGRMIDLLVSLGGKQRLTVELDEDARGLWDELHDGEVEIKIAKARKHRSLDANAYCWVLIDKLAAKVGRSKLEVYREAIRNIGGVSDTVCVKTKAVEALKEGWRHNGVGWVADTMPSKIPGCTNVTLYYGSSTYNTEQMSRLIDQIVQDCEAVGIETMTPAEIQALEETWR